MTKVVFDPSFADARPTTTYQWFADMPKLTSIVGMAEYLNTEEVTNMCTMFSGTSIPDLNLSSFNTENVVDMSGMFAYSSLSELDLTTFDTRNVIYMNEMFSGCSALTTIKVSKSWTMDNVENTTNMFLDCYTLAGANGTTYDEDNVDGTYARFDLGEEQPGYLTGTFEAYAVLSGGNTLTFFYDIDRADRVGITFDLNHDGTTPPAWSSFSYDVTKAVFDPSFAYARPEVTYCWFNGMNNLTDIQGLEYLNTSEVTDMDRMFLDCEALTSLDLSTFDTHKVTNFYGMFGANSYSVLESLDLSSFDTGNATYMGYMFYGCTELKTIYVGDGWQVPAEASTNLMFYDCTSLVGEKGTTFDEAYVDGTYAHIDEGEENPGYLSSAVKREPADVNGDGLKNTADVVAVYTFIEKGEASGFTREDCDVNRDGNVNTADVVAIYTAIIGE